MKSNTIIPPSTLSSGIVSSTLSSLMIRAFPKKSQFGSAPSGSPPSPMPGPGILHHNLVQHHPVRLPWQAQKDQKFGKDNLK